MNKLIRMLTLAGLFCTAGNQVAHAQANDWIIPPNKHMHFTNCCNYVYTVSGISPCGAGSGYEWDQYAGVVSDSNGNGMAFINHCGVYNPNTGASIGSNSSPYTFAIPGSCNQYYSLTWDVVGSGGSRHAELFFHKLDASNSSAITEISATSVYSNSNSAGMAIAPLAADGSRKVYFPNDVFQLLSVTVAPNGTISTPVVLSTLPTRIWDMEVSPNGTSIVINHGNYVTLYDLTTNTETALGGSFPATTVISGIEYVPIAGGIDRVYISYHQLAMASSFTMEGLGYVNLNAPTVIQDALTSIPGSLAKSGFGFTEIERGKNGYLYFAYHSGYTSHWLLNGTSGTLYSTYPTVPSFFVAVSPTTTVSAIEQSTSAFIIQRQIDGEDYRSYTLSPPSFTVNGQSQTSTSIPNILLCDNDLLRLYTYVPSYYSITDIALEKGTLSGTTFTGGGLGAYSLVGIPASKMRDTITLGGGFASFLAGYSGGVRITYTIYNGCGYQAASQIINLQRASTLANYNAITNPSSGFQGSKAVQKTLPISTPMPTGTTLATFKNNIAATVGWFGASSAGVNNITTNGSYALKVYEAVGIKLDTVHIAGGGTRVDTIGIRPVIGADTAPDICYFASSGAVTGSSVGFNSKSLQFSDPASDPNANANFFYDVTVNNQDGADYFKDYYNYARMNGTLNSFNQKIWCVEFTVNTLSGCTVKNTSFFRIATSTLSTGGNAKPAPTTVGEVEKNHAIRVYPNPASDKVYIQFLTTPKLASIVLYDIYGRIALSQENVSKINATLDVKALPAGMYRYKVIADGQTYQGNITKR